MMRFMDIIRKATQKDVKILRKLYSDFILEMGRFDPDDNNLDDEKNFGFKDDCFISNGRIRMKYDRLSENCEVK